MKIGFVGAHGTGKTTTASQLAEELNLPLITEVSRKLKEQGFPILSKGSLPTWGAQMAIFGMQIFEEQKPKFVSDRTLIDNMAYTSVFCTERLEIYKKMLDFSCEYCYDTYDFIFLLSLK